MVLSCGTVLHSGPCGTLDAVLCLVLVEGSSGTVQQAPKFPMLERMILMIRLNKTDKKFKEDKPNFPVLHTLITNTHTHTHTKENHHPYLNTIHHCTDLSLLPLLL